MVLKYLHIVIYQFNLRVKTNLNVCKLRILVHIKSYLLSLIIYLIHI